MLANFPCCRTLVLTGLAVLIGGEILDPPQSTLAAPSSSSEQSSLLIPQRRKPGGSRQLVELPGRRKPGGTREYAELPGRRKPGGTRTDIALLLDQKLFGNIPAHCSRDLRQMTALIPENLQGLTASATPTLYFAVPPLSESPDMEFVLQDDQQQVIYTAQVTPQASGGIMAIKIPSSHALEVNKTYHWYLSAICDANYRERDLVVEGLVQRVETNVPDTSASSREELQFYQQNNLWQDALHTAILLYQQEGQSTAWQELVKSVNLPEFDSLLEEKSVFEPTPEPFSYRQPIISQR